MAPKHHPTPLSGGDRKALNKELGKAGAMTNILAAQAAEMRAKAETMLQQADRRRRYRDCRQSGYDRRTARGRAYFWPDRCALWRDHHRQRTRSAIELQ
jgi:hypothetical protein